MKNLLSTRRQLEIKDCRRSIKSAKTMEEKPYAETGVKKGRKK